MVTLAKQLLVELILKLGLFNVKHIKCTHILLGQCMLLQQVTKKLLQEARHTELLYFIFQNLNSQHPMLSSFAQIIN